MKFRRIAACFVPILGCLFGLAPAARAQDCKPQLLLSSVPITYSSAGQPLVPIVIGGRTEYFLLSTASFIGTMSQKTVAALKLTTSDANFSGFTTAGKVLDRIAIVPDLQIGGLAAKSVGFLVVPDDAGPNGDIAGSIGEDLLRGSDIELDFANNKVNFFSPDHCKGKVVYWPAAGIAAIPIHTTVDEAISFRIAVDGKLVDAELSTGSAATTMNQSVARGVLKVDGNSPGAVEAGTMGAEQAKVFRYPFKSLDLGGLTIQNPQILLLPDLVGRRLRQGMALVNPETPTQGLQDVSVGMPILKKLHLYIAHREGVLYITPGGAPAAPAFGIADGSGTCPCGGPGDALDFVIAQYGRPERPVH